jgi:hypothetical protein
MTTDNQSLSTRAGPRTPARLAGLSLAGGLLTPALLCVVVYLFFVLIMDASGALHRDQPWLPILWQALGLLMLALPVPTLVSGLIAFRGLRAQPESAGRAVAFAGLVLGAVFALLLDGPTLLYGVLWAWNTVAR